MVIAYDLNPPTDETQSPLLKEYLIKFSVMNGKKPLTLDFKTFTTSTGIDYNNGEYVAHPFPEAIKAELAKIVTNPSYLDKTHKDSVSPLPFFGKKKKVKSHTVTPTLPKSQGPEASGSLPNKRQKPNLLGNLADKGLSSMVSDEGTVKTTPLPEGLRRDKDLEGLKPLVDMEPLTNPIVDPSGTGAKYQESDDEEVFATGKEVDEDIPPTNKEVQSPPLNTDKPE
ncbi:hypothetical protein Tco_1321703 [Tanacetum coccineum]